MARRSPGWYEQDRIRTLNYQENALFYLNWIPEAIEAAEKELETASQKLRSANADQKVNATRLVVRARVNLAHHLAELGPHHCDRGTEGERAQRAKQLIRRARKDAGGVLKVSQRDCEGWVLIRFGATPGEIEVGLAFCREALQEVVGEKGRNRQSVEWCRAFADYHISISDHRLNEEFGL